MADYSKSDKNYYLKRLGQLDIERQSFIPHWKELSEQIDPRRGIFFSSDRNKGDKRHGKIINSRGTQALRASGAGMFAGTVSPTRRWFKFETLNQDLMDSADVKTWLYKCENLILAILLDSNFYNAAAITLSEGIQFGTGAVSQLADFDHVVNFNTHTVGSYYIAQNDKGVVDTFVQVRERTVKQIVDEFGLENTSLTIQNHWNRGEYDVWYQICQFIEPNTEFNPNKSDQNTSMAFRSIWFELGRVSSAPGSQLATSSVFTDDKFLRKSGFKRFPVHVFRWGLTGDDIYGTNCPGMVALGDIKSLQLMEKRKAQALDKLINPPLKGPPSVRNVPISSLPGGVTIYDQDSSKEGLMPLYQFEPRIQEMREDIKSVEMRINEAFFVDLFLAISNMEGVQPKNQLELSQRNSERLLMLGPPLERLQQDFLGMIVEDTFNIAMEAGIVPPPPQELSGQAFNINFVSALAQAQKANEVGAIERVSAFISSMAPIIPAALDKFNADQAIEKYAQFVGVAPSIIVPQDQADAVRQQRAQQQQQAMQAAQIDQAAGAAQKGTKAVQQLAQAQDTSSALANVGGANGG